MLRIRSLGQVMMNPLVPAFSATSPFELPPAPYTGEEKPSGLPWAKIGIGAALAGVGFFAIQKFRKSPPKKAVST